MKKALILGVTGQDGSYLAEILLDKGYQVHGLYRRSATGNTKNIEHLLDRIILHKGDLADPLSIFRVIQEVKPQEIYNEADQDNVDWSYATASYSYDITANAVGRTLETIRQIDDTIKFFQPVSATMFGNSPFPQNELTSFHPQSPYACAKIGAYYLVKYYRETYGMFASTAIFYNHDSCRRTKDYLLQKISRAAVRIYAGEQDELCLSDLGFQVDIGYAKEYMEAAYQIIQLEIPDDFVIATGKPYSIREIVEVAFKRLGISDSLLTEGSDFSRPAKQPILTGDITKAREAFGFAPQQDACSLTQMLVSELLQRTGR